MGKSHTFHENVLFFCRNKSKIVINLVPLLFGFLNSCLSSCLMWECAPMLLKKYRSSEVIPTIPIERKSMATKNTHPKYWICDYDAVESERHFLLECSLYDIIRQSVFGDILTDNDFITLSLDQRLVHLKNILNSRLCLLNMLILRSRLLCHLLLLVSLLFRSVNILLNVCKRPSKSTY